MRRPVATFALLFATVAVSAACLDDSITGTRPLTFSLSAENPTAAVGDSVSFIFSATGTSIFGVLLLYGDGASDTIPTESASTVEWAAGATHVYEEPGTFSVIGRLETGAGSQTDTVEVEITEPAGSG
ncbi:MAG: hypothetical protein WD995_08175 [Gemmatimonadota bacterium]